MQGFLVVVTVVAALAASSFAHFLALGGVL